MYVTVMFHLGLAIVSVYWHASISCFITNGINCVHVRTTGQMAIQGVTFQLPSFQLISNFTSLEPPFIILLDLTV